MIEVRNLTKRYGSHLAVDHLSFTVQDGQIYGFLGPNGAGKSTTMNMMTGYLGVTEGEILINGHNILEEPEEAKASIGYLPEMPPLYADMEVRAYLTFCAELKKIPRADRAAAVEQAIEKTDIADVQHRLIKNLSKGYRQRVGLAQAILGMPPIIILDEPTVGLDPRQIMEIRDLIRSLAGEHTVILSSHIMQEISAVCDHVMIISKGQLVASDTPENLQKLNQSRNTLQLEIRGSEEEIRPLLESLTEVRDLKIRQLEDSREYMEEDAKEDTSAGLPRDTSVSAELTTDPQVDIREKVFYLMAENHHPILQMKQETLSLEELFLELTAQGNEEVY